MYFRPGPQHERAGVAIHIKSSIEKLSCDVSLQFTIVFLPSNKVLWTWQLVSADLCAKYLHVLYMLSPSACGHFSVSNADILQRWMFNNDSTKLSKAIL